MLGGYCVLMVFFNKEMSYEKSSDRRGVAVDGGLCADRIRGRRPAKIRASGWPGSSGTVPSAECHGRQGGAKELLVLSKRLQPGGHDLRSRSQRNTHHA